MRHQSDIEKILRSDTAVPDEKIFGSSTCSTPHVQLSRFKKKLERESKNTVARLQCYRLPLCKLPAGLERSPVLFRLATVLNGSTALSKDQLGEQVWSDADGWSDNDVWNGIDRLRDDWSLNIESTGYHQITVKT